MVFKTVTSSITKSGYALSIFGKEWSVLKAELANSQGLGNKLKTIFGGITVPAEQIKADRIALSNYFMQLKLVQMMLKLLILTWQQQALQHKI